MATDFLLVFVGLCLFAVYCGFGYFLAQATRSPSPFLMTLGWPVYAFAMGCYTLYLVAMEVLNGCKSA